MRKSKVIYALIASAMLSIALVGCSGSNETIENDMDVENTTPAPTDAVDLGGVVDHDDVTPTSEPTATSTPEPTVTSTPTPEPTATSTPIPTVTPTPEPTEAPKVTDWFAENGYIIRSEGYFSYNGVVTHHNAYSEDDVELQVHVLTGGSDISDAVDNGDGTKTITAGFVMNSYSDNFGGSTGCGFAFIADRYTGTVFINGKRNTYEDFSLIIEDGTVINLSILSAVKYAESSTDTTVFALRAIVPADYDGLVLGFIPIDTFSEWGSTMSVTELASFCYEGSEMVFCADQLNSDKKVFDSQGTWWLDNNIKTIKLGESWVADETAWFSDSYNFNLVSKDDFFVNGYEYPDATSQNTYRVYIMEMDTNIPFMSCKVIDKYTGLVLDTKFGDSYHYYNPDITYEDGTLIVCAQDDYKVGGGPNGNEFNFYISVPVEYDGALFCVGHFTDEFIPLYYFEP